MTPPSERSRAWIVYLGIFAPLVLLLAVATMTWRSERHYVAVTRRVVHDYAAIAAWQYARRASTAMHNEVMAAFKGIAPGHVRTQHDAPLADPALIFDARARFNSALLSGARFAFTFDTRERRFTFAGDSVDAATRAMLERRLMRLAESARSDAEPHRILFDSAGGRSHAVALWTVGSPDVPVRAVYGLASDPAVLAPRFVALIREPALLPATTAVQRLTENDIAVRLTRPDGAAVFATAHPLGATAATDSSGLQDGELRTHVDLPAPLARALLAADAPRSQLPALGLMILAAAALAIFALIHERRSRELARLRTRFVANVSHELRTPLAQISMFAETLHMGRERSEGERRRFAAIILSEARRLGALVESVLRFSRSEAGARTLHLEPVALGQEIELAAQAFAPIAGAEDVTLDLRIDPVVSARADRGAFRQLVLNLLDNAVKHGARGRAEAHRLVRLTLERRGTEGVISVEDGGPGIPAEWRGRVFEPFVRIERSAAGGAGIGLAVVRDLVAAHGGRVWIEDSVLGGARVMIALPAIADAAVPARAPVSV